MLKDISKVLDELHRNGTYRFDNNKLESEQYIFEDILFFVEPILKGLKCPYKVYPDFIILQDRS